ncbi:proline-rich receptor-like protein kinase PERK9 [Zingiber officinale]|uniref:proline-rich receptor-like protein kinase PERK9 n=1 Tax=Zingiber officinale TaxID=94328 RepID=UPI001C4C534D|nr:proline-rich receptor-like protein kinase PERK9 [Zingiber officinale]
MEHGDKEISEQRIQTTVLSTFAAEATNNVDPATSTNLPNSHSAVAPDRRMITENPMPISDTSTTSLIPFQPIVVSTPHQQASAPQTQDMYPVPTQQYLQPTGGLMIGLPQSYNSIPPPQMINLARPSPLLQQQQQQPMAMIQQQMPPPPAPLAMYQPMPTNQPPSQFTFQQ